MLPIETLMRRYTKSVGGVKMHWMGINEGHHDLSHKPDNEHRGGGQAHEDQ
jgi:hypothetical protein